MNQSVNGVSLAASELVLPVDVISEQVLIAAALVSDDACGQLLARVRPDQMQHAKHRAIWTTLGQLRERGLSVGDLDHWGLVGGDVDLAYVQQLAADRPELPVDLERYVSLVAWDSRRTAATTGPLQSLLGLLRDNRSDPARVQAVARQLAESLEPVESRWQTYSSRCAVRSRAGTTTRLSTGIATLDAATRGGFGLPRVLVIQGPPGSRKTQLASYLAHRWASAATPVVFVAADGGADDVDTRLATLGGLDRAKLEDGDPATWDRAGGLLFAPKVDVTDSCTLDEAVARLEQRAKSRPGVLVLDSLQAIARMEDAEVPRVAVDAVMRRARDLRNRHPWLVLVTSEVGRPFYRLKKDTNDLNPLAAAKESGTVEYAADSVARLCPGWGRPRGRADREEPTPRGRADPPASREARRAGRRGRRW